MCDLGLALFQTLLRGVYPQSQAGSLVGSGKVIPRVYVSTSLPAYSHALSLHLLVIGNSLTGHSVVSPEDVERMCFMVRADPVHYRFLSVAHIRPGHQGPPTCSSGQPSCPSLTLCPQGYVFLVSVRMLLS